MLRLTRCILLLAIGRSVAAQSVPSPQFIDVGSERERVLRALQLVGDVRIYPWSIRGFSPAERDWLTPVAAQRPLLPVESKTKASGPARFAVLPLEVNAIYNSTFPFGYNDGAIWAGRGLTGAVRGGVAARVGPLSVQIEPILFSAQNQSFPLLVNPTALDPLADGVHPREIDQPQRFGTGAYSRFDLGQSTVRLDVGPVFAAASTANQWWGPAIDAPLILGNNAAGFPHVSIGSARPINVWIGSVHGRVVWGRLRQTIHSPDLDDTLRFMSGAVGVFIPRGVPGLEIGAARFFHSSWPDGGFANAPFGTPFQGILKRQLQTANNPDGSDLDNQLASVFARWAFPPAGFEVYGEFARDDHNADLRDFWLEPDHLSGYSLGAQRVWRRGAQKLAAGRFEILNTRISHLQQGRPQAPLYVHTIKIQGHTQLGQVLGAPGAYGGGSSTLAVDLYSASGRSTIAWTRLIRQTEAIGSSRRRDVFHAFEFERRAERGRMSLVASGAAVWNFNRNFDGDRFNLSVRTAARAAF